jgi:hypothetical protein
MTDASAHVYKNRRITRLLPTEDDIAEWKYIEPFLFTETMGSHPEHKRLQVFGMLSHPLKNMRRVRVRIRECCIRDARWRLVFVFLEIRW